MSDIFDIFKTRRFILKPGEADVTKEPWRSVVAKATAYAKKDRLKRPGAELTKCDRWSPLVSAAGLNGAVSDIDSVLYKSYPDGSAVVYALLEYATYERSLEGAKQAYKRDLMAGGSVRGSQPRLYRTLAMLLDCPALFVLTDARVSPVREEDQVHILRFDAAAPDHEWRTVSAGELIDRYRRMML